MLRISGTKGLFTNSQRDLVLQTLVSQMVAHRSRRALRDRVHSSISAEDCRFDGPVCLRVERLTRLQSSSDAARGSDRQSK